LQRHKCGKKRQVLDRNGQWRCRFHMPHDPNDHAQFRAIDTHVPDDVQRLC